MVIINRLMNFLGLQEEDEMIGNQKITDTEEQPLEAPLFEQRRSSKTASVVSIHSQKTTKMILYEPRSYDEAQEIADHLRARRSVIVNLQRVRNDQALRIIDFLSGTVYALNGNISKVGSDIFVCTPEQVEIQGSITEIFQDESEYKQMR